MDHSESQSSEQANTANILGSLRGEQSASGKKTKIINSVGCFTEPPRQPDILKGDETEGNQDSDKDNNNEEDEEMRIAMNMALAIQKNPNLTPEEIRQLVGETQKEQQLNIAAAVASKKEKEQQQQLLIPGRLGNTFLGFKEEDENRGTTNSFLNPQASQNNVFSAASFQDSINKTMQGIVGGTATAMTPDEKIKNTSSLPLKTARETLISMPDSRKQDELMLQNSTDFSVEGEVLLSSAVWKRRSGFGKYNQKAWERRRITLKGAILQYFKEDSLDNEESLSSADQDHIDTKDTTDAINSKNPNWLAMNIEKAKANVEKNIEKAKANMEKNMEKAKANMEKFATTISSEMNLSFHEDDPNVPRGVLHLVKESATVGAAMGHSGSPTPYCLSVKVGKETKWKLCFDTHELQMKWLTALTDIIVKSSVDGYTKPHEDEVSSGYFSQTESWKMDDYQITSIFAGDKHESIKEDGEKDTAKDAEMKEIGEEKTRELIFDNHNDSDDHQIEESPAEKDEEENPEINYKLSETGVYVAAAIVNTALIFTQVSSSTPNRYWHIATLANVGLYLLLSKQCKSRNEKKSFRASGVNKDKVSPNLKSKSSTMPRKTEVATTAKSGERKKVKKRNKIVAFKPRAGSTTMKIDSPEDVPMKNNNRFIGWRRGEDLRVRSHNYLSTKKKFPSIGTLYETVAVDILDCRIRIPDMSSRVTLPDVNFESKEPKRWHAPDLFVVSISLPTDTPSAFGRTTDDGGCYTFTLYYKMREETRKILERVTADEYDPTEEKDVGNSNVNATKLFDEWCRRAPRDDKFMSRFKLIFSGDNYKEIGVPSYIRQYNGKPILIKRPGQTGFLYDHPEQKAMEFEISLHPFPYLAKQAICYLKENFLKELILSVGFLIESRSEDELPECVIGSTQIFYPDPTYTIQGDKLFDGTSPKSHDE